MSLKGTNLSFAYPHGPMVLDQINTAIEPGKITAILGPNGAGKSTLLRLLASVADPSQGQVHLNTQPTKALNQADRAAHLVYIAQRSTLAFDFDVRLVVSLGRYALSKDPQAIDRALDRFDLIDLAARPMGSLSVGQQQRVSLARAWAQLDNQPGAYLLADEPTSAMDPKYQLHAIEAFQELAQKGVGVALVAHDLTQTARFADRVIVLTQEGRIHTQGTAVEVLVPDILAEVFNTPFGIGEIQGHSVLIPLSH